MTWNKRPMFRNAVNMHGGGMVPMPRMQQGSGPMGIASVSPDLFSPAEFMGEPLNQMAETGAGIAGAGFFPEGNFGAPAVTDAGIVAGLDEEMATEPEVKENKLELAKQQAMSIFDQKFDEAMSVMQAQMATGGMPMQDMEMILSDEIEVMEGQAEATVKEAMNLPEEIDLIPAEVAQSYLEKARMIVSAPPVQEQPMDMPVDMGDQAVQKMFAGSGVGGVQPEEDDDPLSIIEKMRQDAIKGEEERRKREAETARGRQTDLDTKIRAGDFSKGFTTDWQKLDDLKEEVKAVAEEEAMNKSYLSPGTSGGGTAFLAALKINPKRAKLAGRKAVLDYEMEIEKLKQAEQQALLQGDAAMLRAVYQQGQKIEDQLSNTLMQNIGDIEERAIAESGDILTKQIGDEGSTATFQDEERYMDMVLNPSKYTREEVRNARNQLGLDEAAINSAKDLAETYAERWDKMGEAEFGIPAKTLEEKKNYFRSELPGFYEWSKQTYGKEFWPNDVMFAIRYEEYALKTMMDSSSTIASGGPTVINVSSLTPDQVTQGINQGFYPSGTVLKTSAGQITVP